MVRLKEREYGLQIIIGDNEASYVDIPLLFSFFMYGKEIVHSLPICCHLIDSGQIEEVYMIPEPRRQIAEKPARLSLIECISGVTAIEVSKNQYIVQIGNNTKFIFITLYPLSDGAFPEITSINVADIYTIDPLSLHQIETEPNKQVYVISTDPDADVSKWIRGYAKGHDVLNGNYIELTFNVTPSIFCIDKLVHRELYKDSTQYILNQNEPLEASEWGRGAV